MLEPKGHFIPSGLMAIFNCPSNQSDPQYLPYLSAFGHEQCHYLQYIGTSCGQFLSDLEDMWADAIIGNVRALLKESRNPKLPLLTWMQTERGHNRLLIRSALDINTMCQSIKDIILLGGPLEEISMFQFLYRKILKFQSEHVLPTWYVDLKHLHSEHFEEPQIDEMRDNIKTGGHLSSLFGSKSIMECAAIFYQLSLMGRIEEASEAFKILPDDVKKGLQNTEGNEEHDARLYSVFDSFYSEPYRAIEGYLPDVLIERAYAFRILSDLSLMTPLGKFNCLITNPSPFDLLPSNRLFRAAEAFQRLGLTINTADLQLCYRENVDAICVDLGWPQPEWIAMHTPRLSNTDVPFENRGILDLQLLAASLRRNDPSSFAFPRAPLIDELKIPFVFYSDGYFKHGVPSQMIGSLIGRYYKCLAAEFWITGLRPKLPFNDKDAFANFFNHIFGIEINSMEAI